MAGKGSKSGDIFGDDFFGKKSKGGDVPNPFEMSEADMLKKFEEVDKMFSFKAPPAGQSNFEKINRGMEIVRKDNKKPEAAKENPPMVSKK